MATLSMNWDIEAWFRGGSRSEIFMTYLQTFAQDIKQTNLVLNKHDAKDIKSWVDLILCVQEICNNVRHASNFVECLTAQDTEDLNAKKLENQVLQLEAAYQSLLLKLERSMGSIEQKDWQLLINNKAIKPIANNLELRRLKAQELSHLENESFANELAVDGYHAWGRHQLAIISRLRVIILDGSKKVSLTMSQANSKMSDQNCEKRKEVFNNIIKTWESWAPLSADAINHLAGFRLTRYRNRGWKDVLKEPLLNNRISQQTLNTMWHTIAKNRDQITPYFESKSQILHLDTFNWYDIAVPLGSGLTKISFEEASKIIIGQVAQLSPKLSAIVRRAFSERWIDAEARTNKTGGGFCTPSPVARQSRIILTYHESISGCAQLAHELGHAYHQYMMYDLPGFIQRFPMTLAEAASIFTESLIYDYFQEKLSDKNEILALLDCKLQNAVLLLMNMSGRFLFEKRFYEMRKAKFVEVETLNSLMVEAQREAFGDSLDTYYPYQWASKEHFYLTDIPFYNFPYTFGYLFSRGLYARYRELGNQFEDNYISLMRDSGRMQIEALAKKYLGMDLTQTEFWQSAINEVLTDVVAFKKLASEY